MCGHRVIERRYAAAPCALLIGIGGAAAAAGRTPVGFAVVVAADGAGEEFAGGVGAAAALAATSGGEGKRRRVEVGHVCVGNGRRTARETLTGTGGGEKLE